MAYEAHSSRYFRLKLGSADFTWHESSGKKLSNQSTLTTLPLEYERRDFARLSLRWFKLVVFLGMSFWPAALSVIGLG